MATLQVVTLTLILMLSDSTCVTSMGTAPQAEPIIGGNNVRKGDSPWLVSLKGDIVKFFITMRSVYCGGSLISESWILTAAHCVADDRKLKNPAVWTAIMGSNNIPGVVDKTKNIIGKWLNMEGWTYLKEKFDKIIVHPDYSPHDSFRHDLALMKLKKPVGRNQHRYVRAVQLPSLDEREEMALFNNSDCFFAGWGCTQPNGAISKKGQKINLRKVSDQICSLAYGVDNTYHFCAGEIDANKGICQGDSGSPLVCFDSNNIPVQVGIASFTSSTRSDKVPGGFVRVSHYVRWIKEVMRRN